MPLIKFTFSGLDALNEFRPFEDGESVKFVICQDVPGTYNKGTFTPQEGGQQHSVLLISEDGRTFLGSRLWASRKGLTVADAPEEVRIRAQHLPLNKGAKMREYLKRCGWTQPFVDDAVLRVTIRLAHVEGGTSDRGYGDWCWFEAVSLAPIKAVESPTADQKQRVKAWADSVNAGSNASEDGPAFITIADNEIGWFAAALGL